MKSLVNVLLHVVEGLHKDVLSAYPGLEVDLSRDYERLALYSQTRGIGLFTLDLPHLESLLLTGLEVGFLTLEGPLSTAVSKRVRVPRLYSGLWLKVFDRHASLKQDVDVTALAFLRQLLVLGKKLELGCSHDRIQAAVRNYHDIERKLRHPTLRWDEDSLGFDGTVDAVHNDLHLRHGVLTLFPVDGDEISPRQEEGEVTHGYRTSPAFASGTLRLDLRDVCSGDRDSFLRSSPLFAQSAQRATASEIEQRLKDARLLGNIQRVADVIVGALPYLNPPLFSQWLEEHGKGIGFKHGPGAVAERLKKHEKSDFPNWPAKLQGTFGFEICGSIAGSDSVRPLNHEVASRLIDVPKTTKGPRLIAAEPTSHQWCQQLVLRYFFESWRVLFGTALIDFKDQSKSGDLVLKASLDKSLATVDLSDASDRLTCWTVERIFRRNPSVLRALHAARTRYLRDDISEIPDFLSLRKFASQGTAVTFPVMSIVMLCIALGSVMQGHITLSRIRRMATQVRVFGDDIIIPAHGDEHLVRAMELLELKVNVAKSYVNGHFRESCGVDGYLGYDVTPCKPKTLVADSPAACQAVVDNANNLYIKGYWNASTACLDLLPPRLRRGIRIVGRNATGFSGLTSYSGSYESHLAKRWNSRLHRYEVRVWSLSVRTQKADRNGFSALLDFFAQQHSYEHARAVSNYADFRKTFIGLHWEPANSDAWVLPEMQVL